MKNSTKWDNKKKVKLIHLEEQARNEGIGFTERLKRAWDECYPEFRNLTIQYLQDNAGRFKKDKTIAKLILVRNREEVTEQLIEVSSNINNKEIEENDNRPGRKNHDFMEKNEQTSQEEMKVREEDEDLRELFQAQMETVITTTKDDIEETERLMKVKLNEEKKKSVNRIVANHLRDDNSLPEIIDAVYSMARAVEIKLEIMRPLRKKNRRENRGRKWKSQGNEKTK